MNVSKEEFSIKHPTLSNLHFTVFALAGMMVLPFLDKAVHIDDPVYLYISRQILENPARPFDIQLNWLGQTVDILYTHNHPPLFSYYLALFIKLFGEKETVLHSACAVFPLMAGYSVYWLGRRFTNHPLVCVLTIMLSPAFFVSASSLMLDVPVLALTLAAAALFIKGLDEDCQRDAVLSGVLLAAACLTKYSAVLMFPVLLFYAWRKGKWKSAILPLGLATLMVTVWVGWTALEYGIFHPLLALGMEENLATSKLKKIFSLLTFIGVSLPMSGFLDFITRYPVFSTGYLIFYFVSGSKHSLLFPVFVIGGGYLIWRVIHYVSGLRRKKDADTEFLLFWLGIGLAFVWIAIGFNAVRHVLIFIPPAILVLVRHCSGEDSIVKYFLPIMGFSALVSFAVSLGDYYYADAYRKGTEEVFSEIRAVKGEDGMETGRVWFTGHWGIQYYMERAGASILEPAVFEKLRSGDWVVDNKVAHRNYIPWEIREYWKKIKTFNQMSAWPVRTMNRKANAGWYGEMWGSLPFGLDADEPLESFILYRIPEKPAGHESK